MQKFVSVFLFIALLVFASEMRANKDAVNDGGYIPVIAHADGPRRTGENLVDVEYIRVRPDARFENVRASLYHLPTGQVVPVGVVEDGEQRSFHVQYPAHPMMKQGAYELQVVLSVLGRGEVELPRVAVIHTRPLGEVAVLHATALQQAVDQTVIVGEFPLTDDALALSAWVVVGSRGHIDSFDRRDRMLAISWYSTSVNANQIWLPVAIDPEEGPVVTVVGQRSDGSLYATSTRRFLSATIPFVVDVSHSSSTSRRR